MSPEVRVFFFFDVSKRVTEELEKEVFSGRIVTPLVLKVVKSEGVSKVVPLDEKGELIKLVPDNCKYESKINEVKDIINKNEDVLFFRSEIKENILIIPTDKLEPYFEFVEDKISNSPYFYTNPNIP